MGGSDDMRRGEYRGASDRTEAPRFWWSWRVVAASALVVAVVGALLLLWFEFTRTGEMPPATWPFILAASVGMFALMLGVYSVQEFVWRRVPRAMASILDLVSRRWARSRGTEDNGGDQG